MKYCFAYIFVLFTFLIECYAQSSLEAHIHGEAKLNIVFEGPELFIELKSPSYNLVGFEHAPRTKNPSIAISTQTQVRSPSVGFSSDV